MENKEIEKKYMKEWEHMPSNIEPLYEIAKHYCSVGNYKKEYFYIKQILSIQSKPHYRILSDYAICLYHIGHYQESFDVGNELLKEINLLDHERKSIEKNRDMNIDHLLDDNIIYPFQKISKINTSDNEKNIIFTITTCKRYDLFHKTINSFINCCTDFLKINKWLCIDDNSSEEDRQKMQKLYPFFEFIFKTPEQKGHVESMNMIYDRIKEYTYQVHMEDDWLFFEKRDYITESISILESHPEYGQLLFNVNYAQKARCRAIAGGIVKYHSNIRYLEHEYYSNKKEYDDFIARNIGKGTQAYWPHYSLRPSVLRVSTLKEIGDYKNETGHFEMDYAKRYANAGYKSAFLDTICSYHIGKCTWERGDNSYTLNGVKQFNNTPIPKKVNISKIEDDIWMVVDNFDSFDNDIGHVRESNIDVLKNLALADPKCVGFNSLGYFKSIILPSHEWKDISNKFDNFKLYIHKERYLL